MTTPSPILGAFGVSRSPNAEDSQEVNLFLELIEGKDGRAPGYLILCPGLDLLTVLGTGPTRGGIVMGGLLYAVSGSGVYQVTASLIPTLIGTIGSASGYVSLIQNGSQVALFDGQAGWMTTAALAQTPGVPLTGGTIGAAGTGYAVGDLIYLQPTSGSQDATAVLEVTTVAGGAVTGFTVQQAGLFSTAPAGFTQSSTSGAGSGFTLASPTYGATSGLLQLSLPFTGGPVSAAYQDGFGVVNDAASNAWYQSNLFDLSVWQPLNFSQADATPDNITAIADLNREVFLFKFDHTEVWVNAGQPGFTFQRLNGPFIEFGTNAPASVAKAGESICFVAQNSEGTREVRRISGYRATRVSTHAIEARMGRYPTVADAEAYAYQQEGHLFYVVSFPTGGETWALDITESERAGQMLWHQRAAFEPTTGDFLRHWPHWAVTWPVQGTNYQPKGVTIETPQEIATTGPLTGVAATFSTALFGAWVNLPDGAAHEQGLWFGNQTDDTAPGTGGVQIGIFNDESSGSGKQLVVRLYDQAGSAIVVASYAVTPWTGWRWIGVSVDVTTRTLQAFAGNGELTAAALTWSSSNAIANTAGRPWHLLPNPGPA